MTPTWVDNDDLLASVRAAAGDATLAWAREPRLVSSTYTADVLHVDFAGSGSVAGEHMLRVLRDDSGYVREVVAHRHAYAAGVPTTTLELSSPATPVFDRAWILTGWFRGHHTIDGISRWDYVRAVMGTLWRIPREMAAMMATIHRTGPAPENLLGSRDMPGTNLGWLYQQVARLGDRELLKRVHLLMSMRPSPGEVTLCHGHVHPLNVLSNGDERVVFDWSYAQNDDPTYDVAVTRILMRYSPTRMRKGLRPVVDVIARNIAAAFVRHYERESGRRIDRERLHFYEHLAALRMLVTLEMLRHRGYSDDPAVESLVIIEPILKRVYSMERLRSLARP